MIEQNLEEFAKSCLSRLCDLGERNHVGVRSRPAALTSRDLQPYRTSNSLSEKMRFESVIEAASVVGAVTIKWDEGFAPKGSRGEGFISRVEVSDLDQLANLVGKQLVGEQTLLAREALTQTAVKYPLVEEVLSRWSRLKTVRGLKPTDAQLLLDAARVLEYSERMGSSDEIARPIREVSAQLFNDSKRIEKLVSAVDILLSSDLDSEPRSADDVWREIGLFREEQPVRLAGMTVVERERVSAVVDRPYVGLAARSIIKLGSQPQYLMSIENQTTFHSEARRLCDEEILLIYTGGMPSPSWRAAYLRIVDSLNPGTPIRHWGDVDEGGFRIAALLARDLKNVGRELEAWRMHPNDVPKELCRPATESTANRMRKFAVDAGWATLGDALYDAKITVEQEGLGSSFGNRSQKTEVQESI